MEQKKSAKYDLERSRPRRLLLSLAGVVALCLVLANAPVILLTFEKLQSRFEDEAIEDLTLDFSEEDEMIAAEQTPTQKEVSQIVQPVETLTEEMPPEDIAVVEPQKEEIVEEAKEEEPEEVVEPLPQQMAQDAEAIERADKTDEDIADELPEYPGGMSAFVTWLTKTLVYPPSARDKRLHAEVHISFIIEKDGSLSDIKVIKSSSPLFNNEALRVARMMPPWKPGKMKGKVCRTQFVIPILFRP